MRTRCSMDAIFDARVELRVTRYAATPLCLVQLPEAVGLPRYDHVEQGSRVSIVYVDIKQIDNRTDCKINQGLRQCPQSHIQEEILLLTPALHGEMKRNDARS